MAFHEKTTVLCAGCGEKISGKNRLVQMGGKWLCEECFQETIFILAEKNPVFLAEQLGCDVAEPGDFNEIY